MRPENVLEQQSLTILEDVGLYLQDFVASLDNLPSEIIHLLAELRKKEELYQDTRRRIKKRDQELSRLYRVYGYLYDETKDGAPLVDGASTSETPAKEAKSPVETTEKEASSTATIVNDQEMKEVKLEILGISPVETGDEAKASVDTQEVNKTGSESMSDEKPNENASVDGDKVAGATKVLSEKEARIEKRRKQEQELIARIREDFRLAETIASEKIEITTRALELINRHIKYLEADLALILPDEEAMPSTPGLLSIQQTPRRRSDSTAFTTPVANTSFSGAGSTPLQTPSQHKLSHTQGRPLSTSGQAMGISSGLNTLDKESEMSGLESTAGILTETEGDLTLGAVGGTGHRILQPPRGRAGSGSGYRKRSSQPTVVQRSITNDNHVIEEILDANGEEKLYCLCRQISYGDMVACDNEECPYEWFHYECVGLTEPPKGAWYCAECLSKIKKQRMQ